jgi:N-acetylglucosaminyldiphosphoundecaprenol N-acetyl-beta-D-mannosaminyltransferase
MSNENKRRIFNIDIDNLTMAETLAAIDRLAAAGKPALVVTPNSQHISLLRTDPELFAAYAAADLIVADGIPLVWLSRLLGRGLRERVAGSDILPGFAAIAARQGYRLFFLGAAPGVAARAAEDLARRHPALPVVRTLSPPAGFLRDGAMNAAIIRSIREARPDVLFIGLGTPQGEVWAWRNKSAAGVPVTVCVGAAFDFLTGIQKRAPLSFRRIGLEWFYRLLHDPLRLWKRYTIGNLNFLWLSLKEMLSSFGPRDKSTE